MSDMNDSRPARWDYERSKGRQLERLRRKSKRSTPSSRNRFERAKRRQREIWRADTRIANEAKYLRSGAVDLNDGIDELVELVVDARRRRRSKSSDDESRQMKRLQGAYREGRLSKRNKGRYFEAAGGVARRRTAMLRMRGR